MINRSRYAITIGHTWRDWRSHAQCFSPKAASIKARGRSAVKLPQSTEMSTLILQSSLVTAGRRWLLCLLYLLYRAAGLNIKISFPSVARIRQTCWIDRILWINRLIRGYLDLISTDHSISKKLVWNDLKASKLFEQKQIVFFETLKIYI